MYYLINNFLSMTIGERAAIFVGILFLLWCVFGNIILKFISILLWILKNIFLVIYILFEIPISIFHSKFGNIFGVIDQHLAINTEKICNSMDKLFKKMNKPKTIYRRRACVIYILISAYLLIPTYTNLTETPFSFWQEAYIKKETAVIQWMNDTGWLENN